MVFSNATLTTKQTTASTVDFFARSIILVHIFYTFVSFLQLFRTSHNWAAMIRKICFNFC